MSALGGKLIRVPALTPHDADAERAILGAVLLGGATLLEQLSTEGLRPEHFYVGRHAEVYRAMLALERVGEGVDEITVRGWLEANNRIGAAGGTSAVTELAGVVPALGNVRSYAGAVKELHRWRVDVEGCAAGLEAAATRDREAFDAAMNRIADADNAEEELLTPEALGERFYDWISHPEQQIIQTPWDGLNRSLRGGLRPGGCTVIAGWTSMGKSVIVDQILEHAKGQGYIGCAYLNEMEPEEWTARLVAARAGVDFDRIIGRDMNPSEWKRVVGLLDKLPFAVQPCAGWSAERIAAHVRRHRWGIFAVDLATMLPASTTQEWSNVSKTLNVAARQSGAHGLIVVQLNQERNKGIDRPPPVLRDLKWTGAWADDAPNVLFVHRDDVEVAPGIYEPGADGHLRLAKARNGALGYVRVSLDPHRMRFVALDEWGIPHPDERIPA